jgi:hypothetical protein
MHDEHNSSFCAPNIGNPKRNIEMQIAQSHQATPSKLFLVDEIYAPSLNPSAANLADAKAAIEAQQHTKAINELHRFLESSCDCV